MPCSVLRWIVVQCSKGKGSARDGIGGNGTGSERMEARSDEAQ